jgi:hypothetical protein
MKELTFEEFCEQPFRYTLGFTNDWGAHRVFRNNELGIHLETVTARHKHGDIYSGWRKGKVHYYLDGDDREFKNMAELYVAWMSRVCGVDHEH